LQIPSYSTTDPDETNDYYSGKYLITAIQHRILLGKYEQDLELVKDSFNTELPKEKPVPLGDVKSLGRAK
jgi:hypothetical protein